MKYNSLSTNTFWVCKKNVILQNDSEKLANSYGNRAFKPGCMQ